MGSFFGEKDGEGNVVQHPENNPGEEGALKQTGYAIHPRR
jgi:hypothetical protein